MTQEERPATRLVSSAAGDLADSMGIARELPTTARSLRRMVLGTYAVQFSVYLLPLVVLPYLFRVLGPERYGAVAYATAISGYLAILVDFGFGFSATRRIAVVRADPEELDRAALSVWSARCGLAVAAAVPLALVAIAFRPEQISPLLFLFMYGVVVGRALLPQWLYQGMERVGPLAIVALAQQAAIVAGVLLFVRTDDDYLLYGLIAGIGNAAGGSAAAWIAWRIFGIAWRPITLRQVRATVREAARFFAANAAIGIYANANPFLLGLLSDLSAVAYYSAAEKVARGVTGMIGPAVQALYPRASRLAGTSAGHALAAARRNLVVLGIAGGTLSTAMFLAAPLFGQIFLGTTDPTRILPIRILSALPFLVAVSNVLGIHVMVPFQRDTAFTVILGAAAVLDVVLGLALAPEFGAPGMATALAITELVITVAMLGYVRASRADLRSAPRPSKRSDPTA